jgi:hypothetical protein
MSWKSLTDVYLQEAAGKNVSKLPRQRVIGEDLRSKMPTDEVQYGLPFDDKDLEDAAGAEFRIPKGRSKKEGAGKVYLPAKEPKLQEKIDNSVAKLLTLGNYSSKLGQGDRDAVSVIRRHIEKFVDMDQENAFQEVLDIVNDLNEHKVKADLPLDTEFNWVDFVIEEHPSKYIGEHSRSLIEAISYQPGKGSVNVGWPELAGIIFLSDTKKASAGDLERKGKLIEVKAKEARMGQGNPDVAIDNIKIAAEKFKLPFSTAGEKGKKAYETLLHMIQVVLDSEKDKSIKEDAIFNILAYGTPKIEVVNEVISSFKEWLSKKDILKLVRDENNIKNIYGALQVLYYWHVDGHKFNTLWACNGNLDSYAFKVDDSTTFSDIYNIIVDHFIVSKLESDYFYGSVGLTVN